MLVNAGAALMLVVALSGGVSLRDSTVSFKQALAACPGSLGSISFALGHARVAASQGVDTFETEGDANGKLSVTLQNAAGSASAAVSIDQRRRSVSAKHLSVQLNGRVACIRAD